jgi:hypothetical protein
MDDDCDGQTDDMPEPLEPCVATNLFGTCQGEEQCVDGETVCDAQEPAPETCNDLDDDCNGETDEGLCIGSTRAVPGRSRE